MDRNTSEPTIGATGTSNIEEYGLTIALKMNVEGVDNRTVPFRSRRYQRFASLGLLNNVQDRIVGIRDFLVAKIHARSEADIDAARGEPKIDVRRHCLAALAAHHASP